MVNKNKGRCIKCNLRKFNTSTATPKNMLPPLPPPSRVYNNNSTSLPFSQHDSRQCTDTNKRFCLQSSKQIDRSIESVSSTNRFVGYVKLAQPFGFFGYHAKTAHLRISKIYSLILSKYRYRRFWTDTQSWAGQLNVRRFVAENPTGGGGGARCTHTFKCLVSTRAVEQRRFRDTRV